VWFLASSHVAGAVALLHWKAGGFEVVTLDAQPYGDIVAGSFWGTRSSNVWLAVRQFIQRPAPNWDVDSALLHYDGVRWSVTWQAGSAKLFSVSGTTADDVFAAGAKVDSVDGRLHPFIMRWDGRTLSAPLQLPAPDVPWGPPSDVGDLHLFADADGLSLTAELRSWYYDHGPFDATLSLLASRSLTDWQSRPHVSVQGPWSISWDTELFRGPYFFRKDGTTWLAVSTKAGAGRAVHEIPLVLPDGSSFALASGDLDTALSRWEEKDGFVPRVLAPDLTGLAGGVELFGFGWRGAVVRRTPAGIERLTRDVIVPNKFPNQQMWSGAGVTALAGDGTPGGVWGIARRGQLLHRIGGRWISEPNPGLQSISAVGAGYAWGVGTNGDQTTFFRWDSTFWKPAFSTGCADPWLAELNSIDATSTDVWGLACGEVWHFDGSTWQKELDGVRSLWADGPSDAWAIRDDPATYKRSLLRFTGSTWSNVGAGWGPLASTDLLRIVRGTGPDDVWVSGADVMLQWDGATWQQVTMPLIQNGVREMQVFDRERPIVSGYGSVQRWNGRSWLSVTPPVWPFDEAPSIWKDASGFSWLAAGATILRYGSPHADCSTIH
jgi:hypothetical protein